MGFWIGALGNFSTGSEGRGVARSPQGPGPLRLRCSEFLSWSLRNVTLFQAPLLLRGKLAFLGPPSWLSGKESACRCRRHSFDPWVGKIPWRRKWQPTPVFLLGKFHGQRGAWWAAGHGVAELDPTEPLSTGFSLDIFLRFITFSYFSHLWPCFPDQHGDS